MQYFILRNASEPELIGTVYPQIEEHKAWCWDNYEILGYLKPNQIPKEEFILDYLQLSKRAILTDLLSDGILRWGFIVNEKVKSIFTAAFLPPHRYFKAHVASQQQVFTNYFWFYPEGNEHEKVDFSCSHFEITNRFIRTQVVKTDAAFSDADSIRQYELANQGQRVFPKKIVLHKKVELDLFQFGIFSYDWLINERLKNKLVENGITGFELKPVDWL